MDLNINQLKTIDEVDTNADSDHDLEELQEKMDYICEKTVSYFYNLKKKINNINNILENNFNSKFTNKNFYDHELIEEKFDELIFEYNKVKELMKSGRITRFYKGKKENNKKKELLYARNALAYYGIKINN